MKPLTVAVKKAAIAALLALGGAAGAVAAPFSYSAKTIPIRAGVLLIESQRIGLGTGVPYNPAPHVWGNLDLDNTGKPAGWSFVNPVAGSTLIESQRTRWSTLGGSPPAGSRVSKRNAAYWEVQLSQSSDAVLAKFDVLLLPVEKTLSLNSIERERLRRFVDQGGVLWVDVLPRSFGAFIDVATTVPLPFSLKGGGGTFTVNPVHPVLNFPNIVTYEDLALVASNLNSNDVLTPVELDNEQLAGYERVLGTIKPDSRRMDSIAGDSVGSTVAVGKLGDGFIVATSRGVSYTLNQGYDRASRQIVRNLQYTSVDPARGDSFTAAAKLVVNAISLTSGYTVGGKGSRKSNSSGTDVGAPLLKRFQDQNPNGEQYSARRSPAIYKGRVIVSSDTRIYVYDTATRRDLDDNGNPDDGLVDPPGAQGDLIWVSAPMPSPISAPAGADQPDSGVARDQVLVTDGAGAVRIFDLNATGNLNAVNPVKTVPAPPNGVIDPSVIPPSPTVHEGFAYMADSALNGSATVGRVWMFDLTTGAFPIGGVWAISGTNRLSEPAASPTVGYVPIQDSSGGVDKVVYVPTRNRTAIPLRPAGVSSVWFGARGEKPFAIQQVGNTLLVTTRAGSQGLPIVISGSESPLAVRVSIIDSAGNPYSGAGLKSVLDGTISSSSNGEIQLGLTNSGSNLDWDGLKTPTISTDDVSIRVDYTIDWSKANPGNGLPGDAFVRGNVEFPDDSSFGRKLQGNVALNAAGFLFAVTASDDKGGSLFSLREEGRGDFKMYYRYDMSDALTLRTNSTNGTDVPYRESIIDQDYITQLFGGFLSGSLRNLRYVGGPTVSGESVFITVTGSKGFIPCTAVMAFKANPETPVIELTNVPPGFSLVQPDVARSNNKSIPEQLSMLQPGQFTYEVDPATNIGKITLSSVASIGRGRIRDSLNTALPIFLRRPGQPDIAIEPELSSGSSGNLVPGNSRGRWSPLRWYTVFNGFTSSSQPMVTGSTMFVAGGSYFPEMLKGNFPPTQSSGFLYGMDSQISPGDPFVVANTVRPWQSQLSQFLFSPNPPGFRVTDSIRWPQSRGVQSFNDFRVRVLQAAIDEPVAFGAAAGDGVLVTWAANQIYTFDRADFLVADEGRIARFDGSGNPIWTSDTSYGAGSELPVGASGSSTPLSRATRVYPDGQNGYFVVDTGNDRVVRLDAAGRELRSIRSMKLDPTYRPQGVLDNPILTLRQPKDALVFTDSVQQGNNPFPGAKPLERWTHYVIADTGNSRIVELVDRVEQDPITGRLLGVVQYFDPLSNKPGKLERALGMLYYHSPSELSGKQYAYNSIARIFVDDGAGGRIPILAFGFGNYDPGRASFGIDSGNTGKPIDTSNGYGGIVLLNRGRTQVIDEVTVAQTPANIFWDEATQTWSSPAKAAYRHKISGLTSVSLTTVRLPSNQSRIAVMFTDTSGVYEVIDADAKGDSDDWTTRWIMPNEAYRVMRRNLADQPSNSNPADLRAVYARRLDSGDVIVVNNYYGRTRGGVPFSGEVVVLDGTFGPAPGDEGFDPKDPGFNWNKRNLGFNSLSVKFDLPPIVGARSIVSPVFANRQ